MNNECVLDAWQALDYEVIGLNAVIASRMKMLDMDYHGTWWAFRFGGMMMAVQDVTNVPSELIDVIAGYSLALINK